MASASDNFNRANSNDPGANWTKMPGAVNQIAILSNAEATQAANEVDASYWSGVSWAADHYSQATSTQDWNGGAFYYQSLMVRVNGSTTKNAYLGGLHYLDSGDHFLHIGKLVSNTYTSLASDGATRSTVGDVLYLEVVGSGLKLKKNTTTVVTATDSSHTSGSPGIYSYHNSSVTQYDDWSAADIVTFLYPELEYQPPRGIARGVWGR